METRTIFYVTLWRIESYYGGPEEGGWWGENHLVESVTQFDNEADAEAYATRIDNDIRTRSREAETAWANGCRAECEWADARGLDVNDAFPETDGPDTYSCTIGTEPPTDSYGPDHYE